MHVAENSKKFKKRFCGVGHKGKIETSVPSNASGKHSSDLSIGLRGSNEIFTEVIEVDKEILKLEAIMDQLFMNINILSMLFKIIPQAEVSLDDGLKAVAIGQAAQLSIIEKESGFT